MKVGFAAPRASSRNAGRNPWATSDLKNDLVDVYLSNQTKLRSFLAGRVRNTDVAEDLLNDLWLKLQSLGGLKAEKSEAYVFRMAANLATDHLRRENVGRRVRDEFERLSASDISSSITPERQLIASDEVDNMKKVIANLPDLSRRIFYMNRFEGLSQREIAQRVGISPTMVFKHIRFVLDQLSTQSVE